MRTRLAARPLLMCVLAAFAHPALADGTVEGPPGIAFAQAPEQSDGFCTGTSPTVTMDCARTKCAAGGAASEDCIISAWCQPAGWSVDMFVQSQEGPHWHEYLCGLDSQAGATAAAAAVCDMTRRTTLTECKAVRFVNPGGTEIPIP